LKLASNRASSRQAQKALAVALKRQVDRLASSPSGAVDVQLLGQVSSAEEWPQLYAFWRRRNRAVGGWPDRLPPESYALNLWPIPAGRIGMAANMTGSVAKRQPTRLLSTPGLTSFSVGRGESTPSTALAVVCAVWLEDVGMTEYSALRLAPPVLESWATGGRLLSREVVDFGLQWMLPLADGI
jgi:hypothetical protein